MFKIGIIQSSSVGAAPTPPPSITIDPVNWTNITYFTINNFYTYTAQQVTGDQSSYSLSFSFDPSYSLGATVSIFKLYYLISPGAPTFNNNVNPVSNNMVQYIPSATSPPLISVPNGYYLSFGVAKGNDYDSYGFASTVSTPVTVMSAATESSIDTFSISINNQRASIDPGDPGDEEEVIP